MKKNERITYGLIITVFIFLIANLTGKTLNLNTALIPNSFITHSVILILSIIAIFAFKTKMNYNLDLPKFKTIFKPIVVGILIALIVNILLTIIIIIMGGEIEKHPLLSQMTPLQVLIFVFFYASIAEELLFRGFLLNFLGSDNFKGITILKRKFSTPVITSALMFGLAHLILLTTGVGILFILRIVIFTFVLGLFAGYYQEKYNNNIFAIIVHMSGNIFAVLGAFLSNMNA